MEIYRHRPDVNAVVHCHPPHATAFAIAREPVPQCILPEVEIFLGEVPTAPYATPGSRAFAESVVPFVRESNVIILGITARSVSESRWNWRSGSPTSWMPIAGR
jgi:L-fuculose-phosphate aldolase